MTENPLTLCLWSSVCFSVMCRVYVSCDSYLSMRVKPAVVAQELLHIVAQRMDRSEDDMMLVVQTYSGGSYTHITTNPVVSTGKHIHSLFCVTEKRVLQPHDSIYSESLVAPGRLIACRRDLSEILVGQTMSTLHCNCVRFWGLKPECSSVMVFVSLSRP